MPIVGDVVRGELACGGRRRTFAIHLPARRSRDGDLPLVLVLHGDGGPESGGESMREVTTFDARADAAGVAVAYPDGAGGGWADGRGVTAADADGVDDVAFLRELIDWSAQRHGTCPDRVTVAGISNGAIMGHRLALEASERVAVLAAVAGSLPDALRARRPTHAVSTLLINGTADPLIAMSGGYSRHRGPNGELRGKILAVPDTAAHWRTINHCDPASETITTIAESPGPGLLGSTRRTVTGGVGGTVVAAWTIHGGGHTWPGSDVFPEYAPVIGATAQNFDAAAEICRFAMPLLIPSAARRITKE